VSLNFVPTAALSGDAFRIPRSSAGREAGASGPGSGATPGIAGGGTAWGALASCGAAAVREENRPRATIAAAAVDEPMPRRRGLPIVFCLRLMVCSLLPEYTG
jgi:hypothetical protein